MTDPPDHVRLSLRDLQLSRDNAKARVRLLDEALDTLGKMYGLDVSVPVEVPRTEMFARPKRRKRND